MTATLVLLHPLPVEHTHGSGITLVDVLGAVVTAVAVVLAIGLAQLGLLAGLARIAGRRRST